MLQAESLHSLPSSKANLLEKREKKINNKTMSNPSLEECVRYVLQIEVEEEGWMVIAID